MSSENAKPDQIQASVAAALSRLRGDLNPAVKPAEGEAQRDAGRGDMQQRPAPAPANDLRADPFFKSIQSTPPQPMAQPTPQPMPQPTLQPAPQPTVLQSQPRVPIPMTPFTRMQTPPEPVQENLSSPMDELIVSSSEESDSVSLRMPEPEPEMSAPISMPEPNIMPTPAPMPQAAQPSVVERPAIDRPAARPTVERGGSALARMMQRPDPKAAADEPTQRDLLAGLPPPPISEPLTADTENGASRRRRRNRMILAGALAIVVVVIGAWLWSGGEGGEEVPVITAEATPEKVAPVDEGGLQVENQNVQILNGGTDQPIEETLLPAPEQPVTPPETAPEATVEQEAPAVIETPPSDPNATPAAPAVAEAPVVDAPPAPEVPLANVPLPEQTEAATNATPEAEAAATQEPVQPAQEPAQAAAPVEQPVATPEPAAAPEPAATQQAVVQPSTTGNARIQLAAVKSEAAAQAEWAKMQKAHPDLLGSLSLTIQTVDKNGTTFYRIQAGPLDDKAAAKNLCGSLKQQGQDCLVAK